ncbi:type IV toxin-antitoxin system YeeU family antitoxin [Raoultella planticola]
MAWHHEPSGGRVDTLGSCGYLYIAIYPTPAITE